jgi:prevent-host-death family protein
MPLADHSPTLTADRAFFGALNGDDQLASFVDFCAQYPHIGNIHRNRNLCPFHLAYSPVESLFSLIYPPDVGGTTAIPNEPKPVDKSLSQGYTKLVRLVAKRCRMGSEWKLQDAKSRFSELFNRAITEGAQVVSRRGKQKVVVVSKEEYDRLIRPEGSLSQFLLNSPLAGTELNLERVRDLPRSVEIEP